MTILLSAVEGNPHYFLHGTSFYAKSAMLLLGGINSFYERTYTRYIFL